jgi:hypothetical protein
LYNLDNIACDKNMLRMAISRYDFTVTFHRNAAVGKIQVHNQIDQRNPFREGSTLAV